MEISILKKEDILNYSSFKNRCLKIKENNKVLDYAYLNTFNERSTYRYTADLSIYIDKDHLHEHLEIYYYHLLKSSLKSIILLL